MITNDVDLIARILEGDERAFTLLVKKYQKWVHTLVWRRIGDFHIAEEITQDIFLKVHKRLSTLKHPDRFPGWLYVISTRRCIAWLRKKKLPTTSLDAMPTNELEERCYAQYETDRSTAAAIEHQRDLVKRLLQTLPESERTVMTLYYLAEMTSKEISTFLGMSPNTVRSRLSRARKRLAKQEHLLHDASGIFQLPPTLVENIVSEIARIQPLTPPMGKPWMPWAFSFAATLLILLTMGVGPRALSRFQHPYNLDATAEMTIELVDALVVLDVKRMPDVKTRFGTLNADGGNRGVGVKTDGELLAAAQAEIGEVRSTEEPYWIPARGPEGGPINSLFVTSQKDVYAIGGARLYRLASNTDNTSEEWTLINAAVPFTFPRTPMAEHDGTLYIVTETALLASQDRGVTLHLHGSRPPGPAIALLTPRRARWSQNTPVDMYLVLTNGVFRSTDTGRTWQPLNDGLTEPGIQTAVVIENVPFLGTKQGLYRLRGGVWEKLSIAQTQSIGALAVAGDTIYVSPAKPRDQKSSSIFASSDFGESWIDITPTDRQLQGAGQPKMGLSPLTIGNFKLLAVGDTLLVLGTGILRSRDAGDTWKYLGFHQHALTVWSFPVVAIDEKTFFLSGTGGLVRSTDGGSSWHPFTGGIAEPNILDLEQVNNVLYAVTYTGAAKSIDGGDQWTQIDTNLTLPPAKRAGALGLSNPKTLGALKLANMTPVGDSLYVRAKQGGSTNCLFHLLPTTDTLLHIEGMPVYVDPDHGKWLESQTLASAPIEPIATDQGKLVRYRLGIEEAAVRTTGEFAISGDTFYIEYERKLYRWTRNDPEWHDTGMHDAPVFADLYADGGFQFAVSGKMVYLGKSDGRLFRSVDGGDDWTEVTANFPFPLNRMEPQEQRLEEFLKKLPHFREILFVGSTVYVSTPDGVALSNDGENWQTLTDSRYEPIPIRQLAIDGTTLYGVSQTGVYRLNNDTGIWEQLTSEVPGEVTALVVARNMLYIGTKRRGILRFPL